MRSILSVASFLTAVTLVIAGVIVASGLSLALNNLAGEPEDVTVLLLLLFCVILAAVTTGLNGIFLGNFCIRKKIPFLVVHLLNLASLGIFVFLGVAAVASYTASPVEMIFAVVPMLVVTLGYWGCVQFKQA